jgi:cGMP-dependent protein kinase
MGGELEKSSLNKKGHQKKDSIELGKSSNRNHKYQSISTDDNPLSSRNKASKSAIKTTNNVNNDLKRGAGKKKKERVSIFSKDKDDKNQEKKVLEIIHEKNPDKEDYDLIYSIISNHFLLQTLNDQAKNEIIISMSLYSLKEGKTLFEQGSPGNFWYIVQSGELSKFMNNRLNGTIKAGQSFGEHALMNNSPRNNTVIADTDCRLWALRRQVFKKILEFIFTSNYEQNMKFLNGINIPLDSTIKSIMANNLIQEIYHKDQYIFREGEFGSCMYIIKEGEVDCIKGDKIIRTLKQGDNFGQKALLEGDTRSLDVKAKTDCQLYSISSEFFKNQFGENFKEYLYFSFVSSAFNISKVFNKINGKMISKTFSNFSFRSLKNNELVYPKGQKITEKLCVVLEGNIVDKKINKVEAKRYQILYENELSEGSEDLIKHDLLAEPDCVLAEIDFEKFKEILGGDLKTAQTKSNQLNSFGNISLFRILSDDKIEFLQNNLKLEKFQNGKKIINQGDIGDKLFIIKSGRVDFFVNSRYIRSSGDGEDFGAKSLILSEKRTATAIANGEVYCYTLSAKVFKSILEPNLEEYFTYKFYLEDNTIELKDLDNIKELGSGNFGSVNLVRNKKNKQLYAIKALNLEQIKKESLEVCVELEKNVLLKTDHPFIMKMVKYLKNDSYIFFINEYIKGKELWDVIRDIGLLNKEQTQFYGASILLAINHLHKKKIIYRDIKPENVMVNTKGYIKIIDFGTVKEIEDRTSTIIGTSHYMAPEITKGEGYSFQVDIWSIAVCLYEFFCGKLPFGEEYEDPMDIYRAVSKEELSFPNFVHDDKFMSLLNKMLKKNPTQRLWKFEQIKEDPYFKDFDWNKLMSLSYPPPYMIKMKEDKENNSPIPYLTYLQSKQTKRGAKKKKSNRQIKFEKWLKNF